MHAALIMDGNGRWAQLRGLSRLEGHHAGLARLPEVLRSFADNGVSFVTVYAFSTENWRRPTDEVEGLMELLAEAVERDGIRLHEQGIRILHLGRMDRLSPALVESIRRVIHLTRDNHRLTLGVAFDYGGRHELLEAVRRIVNDGIPPSEITEEAIRRYLYTADIPDPDLVIRTGGEMRLSNFLLWQAAYAEFYATPTLWPDFGPVEVERALQAYAGRQRRFGSIDLGD